MVEIIDNECEEVEFREQEPQEEVSENATVMQLLDALLKRPYGLISLIMSNRFRRSAFVLLLLAVTGYMVYGLIVGSFSGNSQWFAAPLKITFGCLLSSLLCFPSLYIFACLSGATISPSQALAMLCSGMALTAVLLMGFAPVAFIFTFSIETLFFMGLIHILLWAISMYFGLNYILAGLARMSCKKQQLMKIWGIVLIVTMLQMSTTLRPIIGESSQFLTAEKRFFVEHWIENRSLKN